MSCCPWSKERCWTQILLSDRCFLITCFGLLCLKLLQPAIFLERAASIKGLFSTTKDSRAAIRLVGCHMMPVQLHGWQSDAVPYSPSTCIGLRAHAVHRGGE